MRIKLLLAASLASAAALAQEAPAPAAIGGDARPPVARADMTPEPLDELVVTAARVAQPRGDVAAQIEVIGPRELDRTTGLTTVDLIKKNASVDLIEYPGGLSGIGLRGFRPEFSGTNQHVLVLLDGRPAGVTSLGNLPQAGISRIEVLKGAASSLYGSSALGGVVNVITAQSSGPLAGSAEIAGGSFGALFGSATLGGTVADGVTLDAAFKGRDQPDDYRTGARSSLLGSFRQGGGAVRAYTGFANYSGYGRVAVELAPDWTAQVRLNSYSGVHLDSPGAESDGTTNQGFKNDEVAGGDASVTGALGDHRLLLLAHLTQEKDDNYTLPLGRANSTITKRTTIFRGAQLQDSWQVAEPLALTFGLDWERVSNDNSQFNQIGAQLAPSSPDDTRETFGFYGEGIARLWDDRLVLNAGVRVDKIGTDIRSTPLRPDLNPGGGAVSTANPRGGIVLRPLEDRAVRLHASAGSGFVAPLAAQLGGFTDTTVSGQRRITQGNPGLQPETADTYDAGIGYETGLWSADLTWFRTDSRNRVELVTTANTTALRVQTYVNADTAHAEGYEASAMLDAGPLWGAAAGVWSLTGNATYYTSREEVLPTGPAVIRNLAHFKGNLAAGYDDGFFAARLNGRYVQGVVDQDFSTLRVFSNGKGGLFKYPRFFVADLDLRLRLDERQELGLQIDNIADQYYFEKNDYPGPGRAFTGRYRYRF